jgi:hypothetical protein
LSEQERLGFAFGYFPHNPRPASRASCSSFRNPSRYLNGNCV